MRLTVVVLLFATLLGATAAEAAKRKIPGTNLFLSVGAGREVVSRTCVQGRVMQTNLTVSRESGSTVGTLQLMSWKNMQNKRCFAMAMGGNAPYCWSACTPTVSRIMDEIYGATVVRFGLAAASAMVLMAVPLAMFGAM